MITQDGNKAESSVPVSALFSFQMNKLKGIILPCGHRKTCGLYKQEFHMFHNISQCALNGGRQHVSWKKGENETLSSPLKPLKMNAEIRKREQTLFPPPELATDGQSGARKSCIIIRKNQTLLFKIVIQIRSTKVKIFVI